MNDTAFAQMKTEIMRSSPPSGGDDLLGMEIDFNARLFGLDVLDDAQARRTDDVERLIVATATAKLGSTAGQVAAALEDVWTGDLRYSYREGHLITNDGKSIRLSAVTQIAPDGFYVTAEVVVALHN